MGGGAASYCSTQGKRGGLGRGVIILTQPVAELHVQRKQINMGRVENILKVLSAAAIQPVCLTTDHSLDLGDFTEGRKSGETREKNPRSTEEANYNNSTHMSSKFFENQHRAIPRWSPIQLL